MGGSEPKKTWAAKRIAALLLSMALLALLVYSLIAGVGDAHTRLLLSIGIASGLFYTTRGGSLPPHWIGGTEITAYVDPRNLAPKLYLPILFAVIVLAGLLYYCYGPRR